MKLRYTVISDVGKVRTNNEDMALVFEQQVRDSVVSFTFDMPENIRFAAVVADGMGGYEGGEIASEMITSSFNTFLNDIPSGLDPNDLVLTVKQWVKSMNDEILRVANGSGMGSTLCGIFIYEGDSYIINIGDSRTYRLRYDLFKQLTTDHSQRNLTGDIDTPSNLIYNAFGVQNIFADIKQTMMVSEDKFIICSDGLTDLVDDLTIESTLKSGGDITRQLLKIALNNGGYDNISIILLEVFDDNDC